MLEPNTNDFPKSHKEISKKSPPFFTPNNIIVIYTTIRIIEKMRHQLGLEAMLEYCVKFTMHIDRDNPQLQKAVTQALDMMSLEKMYRDTVGENEL